MRYLNITYPDVNNGKGCRVTLWISGCIHHCRNCQNRESWNFNTGNIFTLETQEELFNAIDKPYIQGLTLSGGDPLCSYSDGLLDLLKNFREKFNNNKDIWLYSGFTLDFIKRKFPNVLNLIDVVVDGKFIESLKDTTLMFRGSSNQIIWEKNDKNEFIKSILNDKGS